MDRLDCERLAGEWVWNEGVIAGRWVIGKNAGAYYGLIWRMK